MSSSRLLIRHMGPSTEVYLVALTLVGLMFGIETISHFITLNYMYLSNSS